MRLTLLLNPNTSHDFGLRNILLKFLRRKLNVEFATRSLANGQICTDIWMLNRCSNKPNPRLVKPRCPYCNLELASAPSYELHLIKNRCRVLRQQQQQPVPPIQQPQQQNPQLQPVAPQQPQPPVVIAAILMENSETDDE